MFTTFPVRPRTPTTEAHIDSFPRPISPKPSLKREHRVARIYQPSSPTLPPRPQTAHIQPDRPAPILTLPGLPPRELPRSVVAPSRKKFKFNAKNLVDNGRSWLAQLRPPWSEPTPEVSVIPPVTPKSHKFASDEEWGYTPKSAKFSAHIEHEFHQEYIPELQDEYTRDPPPLYKKHAPEGGLYGWMTVAGAFLIQFSTIGYMFTWNVFEEQYTHVVLVDQNSIAVRFIASVQFFFALFLSIVSGKLADIGYFRFAIHGGSFLFIVGLMLLSFVGEEQFGLIFVCQSLVMGMGMGLVLVPTIAIPLNYFKRSRGLVAGIVMGGGSLGGMVFPPVLRRLIPHFALGGAVRITAFVVLGLLIVGNGLLRTPPKEEKPIFPLPHLDLAKYSKEMEYIFAAGATFLTMLIIYYPAMYLELLGLEKGVKPDFAFNMIIVFSLSGVLGGVAFGFASDFVGPWNLLLPISGFLSIMMFTTCTIQGPKSLCAYAFFYGIFAGAWLSLMATALASLASRNSEIGTRIGLVLTISSIGALASDLLQAAMLTPNHIWAIPSAVAGVILIGVTGLLYMSRTTIAAGQAPRSWRRLKLLKDVPVLKDMLML
ncbi:Aspyridones efflux protein apdF [Psilocybe cubensis]|uniref:Aspyridones efflux protein apdF n=2 Tax=Psilocybe cubensis TaxID=181762 RepID=A0ACB8GJJ0_PSICU|nr:Aspyridones efflux protein apdF [Psilocybe cubensis]KAH9475863.1 Aspyridones efflux protein apdF [Psilocybe cubensis]